MIRLRLAWRLARVFLHLLVGLGACALVFPWARRGLRDAVTRRWSRRLLAICGVRVETAPGSAVLEHALFVSNHISWLDIFVINSLDPSVPMRETFKGVMPFFATEMARIAVLVAFPAISLFLPRLLT